MLSRKSFGIASMVLAVALIGFVWLQSAQAKSGGNIKFATKPGMYYRLKVKADVNRPGIGGKIELTLLKMTNKRRDGKGGVYRKVGRLLTTSSPYNKTKTMKLDKNEEYQILIDGYNYIYEIEILANKQGAKYNPTKVAGKKGSW